MTDDRPTRSVPPAPWLVLAFPLLLAVQGCAFGPLHDRGFPPNPRPAGGLNRAAPQSAAVPTSSVNQPLPPLPADSSVELEPEDVPGAARAPSVRPAADASASASAPARLDTEVTRVVDGSPDLDAATPPKSSPPRTKLDLEVKVASVPPRGALPEESETEAKPEVETATVPDVAARPPSSNATPRVENVGKAGPASTAPRPPTVRTDPKPAPEPPPSDPWKDGLERLRNVARKRAEAGDDSAPAWSVYARVLESFPRTPAEAAKAGELPVWNALLPVLTRVRSDDTPDAAAAAADLDHAISALEGISPLRIGELQVCRKVIGFGHYETVEDSAVRAGVPVIVYCEISGLKYDPVDGGFRSKLASHVELFAKSSGKAAWSQELGTAEDVCRHRRRDFYVNYRLIFPTNLPPGHYELRVTQTDLNSDHTVTSGRDIEIRP